MAVTKIWNIRGKAGSPLEYIANPEKTEREFTRAREAGSSGCNRIYDQ